MAAVAALGRRHASMKLHARKMCTLLFSFNDPAGCSGSHGEKDSAANY